MGYHHVRALSESRLCRHHTNVLVQSREDRKDGVRASYQCASGKIDRNRALLLNLGSSYAYAEMENTL